MMWSCRTFFLFPNIPGISDLRWEMMSAWTLARRARLSSSFTLRTVALRGRPRRSERRSSCSARKRSAFLIPFSLRGWSQNDPTYLVKGGRRGGREERGRAWEGEEEEMEMGRGEERYGLLWNPRDCKHIPINTKALHPLALSLTSLSSRARALYLPLSTTRSPPPAFLSFTYTRRVSGVATTFPRDHMSAP